MAYCYVLDIELSAGKLQEANEIATKIATRFREKHNANLEVFSPHSGNVHRILGIFRFETLTEYEEFMKQAGADEELMQLEHQFHSMMTNPIYNLYSTLC